MTTAITTTTTKKMFYQIFGRVLIWVCLATFQLNFKSVTNKKTEEKKTPPQNKHFMCVQEYEWNGKLLEVERTNFGWYL